MAQNETWRSALPEPTPEDIRKLRGKRTLVQMAEAAGLSANPRWAEYEAGKRRPHWAAWELLLLKEGCHPQFKLVKRR